MRLIQLFIFIALLLVSCKSKDKAVPVDNRKANEDIKVMVESYYDAIRKSDWSAAFDLIHPDVFKMADRAAMEKQMKDVVKGEGYEMLIQDLAIDSVSPVITDKSIQYALVTTRVTMLLKLTTGTDSSEMAVSDAACASMREEFGQDLIACEEDPLAIRFKVRERAYAILLPGKKRWYYLAKDEDSEEMVRKIVPGHIMEKLGY